MSIKLTKDSEKYLLGSIKRFFAENMRYTPGTFAEDFLWVMLARKN